MPEEVYIDKNAGVITIRSWGRVSEQEIYNSKETVKNLSEESGLNRLLVDARERTGYPGVGALYHFVGSIASNALLRQVRSAIVISEESTDESEFIENTAYNRGVNIKLFQTKEEAINWLKGDG